MRFFELGKQKRRVLLNEEDIGLQLVKALQKLLQFCLLIKEAQLVEVCDSILEERCVVFDGFFKLLPGEGVLKQGMVHDEVVKPHSVLLVFLPVELESPLILLELFVPLLLELLLAEQRLPEEADLSVKHVGVPSLFEGFIDFAHVPLEGLLIKLLDIEGHELPEGLRYFVDFSLVIFEVELEGAEGDATVVESSDGEVWSGDLRDNVRQWLYFIKYIIEVSH